MSSPLLAAPDPTTATLERSAIEEKYKWDLSKMYASQEDWEAHYKKVESMINEFAAKTGKIGDSEASLLEALKLGPDQYSTRKVAGFSSLRRDEDMRVSANQGLFQRAQTLAVKWVRVPPVSTGVAKSAGKTNCAIGSSSRLSRLPTLLRDLLRSKAHILSSREENCWPCRVKHRRLLRRFGLLSNTELPNLGAPFKDPQGKDVEITSSSYTAALQSKDRDYAGGVRRIDGSFWM